MLHSSIACKLAGKKKEFVNSYSFQVRKLQSEIKV